MTARLHVFLGAGGVGKTTLAAGYAMALAAAGGRVGLLGVDPARRLSSALGLALEDLEAPVPCPGTLHAALLRPTDSLRRWAAEATGEAAARERLIKNPFFLALADRLAGASDVFAAIRVAEWAERSPLLTDLVVDTAPGLNAVEFLRRPQRLSAFLEGRLVTWLRWLARDRGGLWGSALRGASRRVLGGLARIGGTSMLFQLAEFLSLVEAVFERMAVRLEAAQRWLRDGSTQLLLVTAVREDAGSTARQLAEALGALSLPVRAVVLNRALPDTLAVELAAHPDAERDPEAAAVFRFARAFLATQARAAAAVATLVPAVVTVPAARGLDEAGRLEPLAALGERLRAGLLAQG